MIDRLSTVMLHPRKVIKTFLHKGLKELFGRSKTAKVSQDLQKRCRQRLLVLHAATKLGDVNLPGFDFHPLLGTDPRRYAIKVSGPWRITSEWEEAGNALRVDLEQYH
jgi:proteic killer suppression protein